MQDMQMQDVIKQQIAQHPVIIYMKGSATAPMCGFSARAVSILRECGCAFTTIDVLDNPELRQAIKVYSDWPTIPQIYIKQQFIGGSDILAAMYDSGELQLLLKD
jgi:monothiol glutaredoxin